MAGGSAPRRVNRREAIRALATGVGATASALWVTNLVGVTVDATLQARFSAATLPQATGAWTPKVFSPHQLTTVGTLVELIIPTTDTPGARTALADRYVDAVLDAAAPADRDRFLSGLAWLDTRSWALYGQDFVSASAADQTALLTRLSAESQDAREASTGAEFFTTVKRMTITGYFSTEIGLRQELGDDGRLVLASFEGCTHPEHQ